MESRSSPLALRRPQAQMEKVGNQSVPAHKPIKNSRDVLHASTLGMYDHRSSSAELWIFKIEGLLCHRYTLYYHRIRSKVCSVNLK